MPFKFPEKRKETVMQKHFPKEKNPRGYDLNDDDIPTDVLGSYTGTPYDGLLPVQDADDL